MDLRTTDLILKSESEQMGRGFGASCTRTINGYRRPLNSLCYLPKPEKGGFGAVSGLGLSKGVAQQQSREVLGPRGFRADRPKLGFFSQAATYHGHPGSPASQDLL